MGIDYYQPGTLKPMRPFKRGTLGVKDRWIVINRDNFRCYECKKLLVIKAKYFPNISIEGGVFHHVLQQVFGGENDYTNCCIICNSCHKIIHGGNEVREKYLAMQERFLAGEKLNG
jgi:5-methylcytosine-specific restriction endonuclease McrA